MRMAPLLSLPEGRSLIRYALWPFFVAHVARVVQVVCYSWHCFVYLLIFLLCMVLLMRAVVRLSLPYAPAINSFVVCTCRTGETSGLTSACHVSGQFRKVCDAARACSASDAWIARTPSCAKYVHLFKRYILVVGCSSLSLSLVL